MPEAPTDPSAGSPASPALTREWIVCALVAASARFVPVPILDDAIADQAVREAVRRTLRSHGREYPVDAVAPLFGGQNWAVSAAMGLIKLPLKFLLFPARKIMRIVGAVHGVPTDITRVLALAHATDRVLAAGGLAGGDTDALRGEARRVRRAFDSALGGMDLRLIQGALADTLSGVRGLSESLIAYARDRFDRDRRSGSLDPGGPIGEGVSRVQEALRRPEVRRQIAQFDRRFDQKLAGSR